MKHDAIIGNKREKLWTENHHGNMIRVEISSGESQLSEKSIKEFEEEVIQVNKLIKFRRKDRSRIDLIKAKKEEEKYKEIELAPIENRDLPELQVIFKSKFPLT